MPYIDKPVQIIITKTIKAYIDINGYILPNTPYRSSVVIFITEIISKPVLCLSDATTAGTVQNAVFDKKLSRITYICVFEEQSGNIKYISASNIISAAKNAVTVKNSIYFDEVAVNSPLKAAIYGCEGEFLGVIEDIALTDDLKVLYLKEGGGKIIKPQQVITFSPFAAVYCENGQKPRYIKNTANPSDTKKQKKTPSEKTNTTKRKDKKEMPICFYNIVPPYNYLIGRKTTADIYDNNKKLIIKKSGIITLKTIDLCRKNNMLMRIAKNSKKTK